MSKVVRSAEQRLAKWSITHVYCSNDCLMIFLSTAQSQYSFQCLMIWYAPQLGKSQPSGLPQWQPVIGDRHEPVMHSHHVAMATIASSVALFNQSSQTESTRVPQAQPAVHRSASQRHQQSVRHSSNLLEVISDFPWLCRPLFHSAFFKYVHVIRTTIEGTMYYCYTVTLFVRIVLAAVYKIGEHRHSANGGQWIDRKFKIFVSAFAFLWPQSGGLKEKATKQ